MFQKISWHKITTKATCLCLVIIIILSASSNRRINDATNYIVKSNATLQFLQRAISRETQLEDIYQLTAIVLHWKRLSRVQQLVQHYISTAFFKEIIIWNNNPQINLTLSHILSSNESSNLIRIINSKENLKDEAKYRACAAAQTLACFYADDDWKTLHYMKSLIASFRSDPHVLHSATNPVTYYNNMLWTFMDSRIDLHAGFSWIGCGSVFLRQHAQRHLQLLTMVLKDKKELFAFSDLFFSIWLNAIPSQLVVNLISLPTTENETDTPFSSTENFYYLQDASSILAVRKLEHFLRLKQSAMNVSFPREQNRRFSNCVRSPSPNDEFVFYSNVLPVDIEHMPFDITVDADRATYRNVPRGPNYTHFVDHNTLKAVDINEKTCWRPIGSIKRGDFYAIDFLRIQAYVHFSLIIGHNQAVQNNLNMRISFDGIWWITYHSSKGISINPISVSISSFQRLVIDSREFPRDLQSFRYIGFNATRSLDEPFQVCDIKLLNKSPITSK